MAHTDRRLTGRTPTSPLASVAPSAPPLPSHTSLHNPTAGHMSPMQHHSETRLAQAAVDGAGGTVTRPDAVSYPSIFGASSLRGSSSPQSMAESALPSQSCSVRAGTQQIEGGQYGSDSQQAEAVQADMPVLGYVPFALTSMFKRLQVLFTDTIIYLSSVCVDAAEAVQLNVHVITNSRVSFVSHTSAYSTFHMQSECQWLAVCSGCFCTLP